MRSFFNVKYQFPISIGFIVLCLLPPIANVFESSMVGHMLIQLPLLTLCGAALLNKKSYFHKLSMRLDPNGVIGLIIGSGWLFFWMLPMHLDLATIEFNFRLLKVVVIPLGIGLCLRWAWQKSNLILKIVLLFEGWASIARLGFLYVESPEQLCSSYLIGEQQEVGKILLAVAAITGVTGLAWGVFGKFRFEGPTTNEKPMVSEMNFKKSGTA